MEINILFGAFIISFLCSFLFTKEWIKKMWKEGYLWEDMNKPDNPKNVASSGGFVVIMGFVAGVLYYIAIRTFVFHSESEVSLKIFALLCVILILALVGVVDDFLGWKNGGLSTKVRLIISFVAATPLVVINAGNASMGIPFFGNVNLGLIYPLLAIPIGVAGATTTYNFLAGFNGLETGQGILILSFLSFVAYSTGTSWLGLIGLIMVAALLGFYFYNKNPARVFPGDSLTWGIGALIAGMAILGNFEKIALIVFIPYIIETGLKLRGKLKKHSFGQPNPDGSLELKYDKIYGLTHFSIWFLKKFKGKVYENDVVWFIYGIQLVFIAIGFLML